MKELFYPDMNSYTKTVHQKINISVIPESANQNRRKNQYWNYHTITQVCHNYNGSSVVDYGIVSETLLQKINFFKVHRLIPDLSDHCQISLMLKVNCVISNEPENTQPLPPRYIWSENSALLFQEALSKPDLQHKIQNINGKEYDNVDNLTDVINTVLCDAAELALQKIPV